MASLKQKILAITLFTASTMIVLLHVSLPLDLHQSDYSLETISKTREAKPQKNYHTTTIVNNNKNSNRESRSKTANFVISPRPILQEDIFQTPFRPPTIEEQLNKFKNKSQEQQQSEDDNSVPVSQEDVDFALANWIHPFEKISSVQASALCGDETQGKSASTVCKTLISIWNSIENFVAKRANSNAPVVTFIELNGGSKNRENRHRLVLERCYLAAHQNVTVISSLSSADLPSVSPLSRNESKRLFQFSPLPSSSASWLFDRSTSTFGNFWISCNFVAQTFVFDSSLLLTAGEKEEDETERSHQRLSAIFASLPMSLHVFALLRPSEVLDIEHSIDPKTGQVVHPPHDLGKSLWEGTVQKLRIKIEKLVRLCPSLEKQNQNEDADSTGCLEVIEIHVLESQRACAKTWGAPLVQWGRKLVATRTSDGEISFQVQAVTASAKGSGRKVHPLQYIPSVNLDTLLGAGLPVSSRIGLLADMIKTPRYSDPLPHNWVVGRGGRAIRIDRVDKRYDRDVDETKGYWGKSTRGYLHLLGHHLCLKIKSKSGLPAVMAAEKSCSQVCEQECAAKCTRYADKKGELPCSSCMKCGDCVDQQRFNEDLGEFGVDQISCHIEYSSMHAARKKWKEWEKLDKKNGNIP